MANRAIAAETSPERIPPEKMEYSTTRAMMTPERIAGSNSEISIIAPPTMSVSNGPLLMCHSFMRPISADSSRRALE